MLFEIVSLVVVALLWGGTNPLIRVGSKGIENIKEDSAVKQKIAEIRFLFTRWQYLLPFLLNQSGSIVYFYTLQQADLSLAVPVANSLTFVFTGLVGQLVGEKQLSIKSYLGTALIVLGTSICVYEKAATDS